MKSIVFAVILAIVCGVVVGHHHYGHHKHDFDHHQPRHYKPHKGDPWNYRHYRSPDSPESSEYDSNEWSDDDDRSDTNSKSNYANPWNYRHYRSPDSPQSSEYDSDEWSDDDDTNSPPSLMREPSFQECMRSCHLPPDYAPVCGTDDVTYKNLDHLHCTRQCGVAVSVRKLAKCINDKNNGGWNKDIWTRRPTTTRNGLWTRTPSTTWNGLWTKTPSTTENGFWTTSTKTPPTNGNGFWPRSPTTNSLNLWTNTPKSKPSSNNNFWSILTTRTPSIPGYDTWTKRPPNTWSPSTNANNGWTTPTPSDQNSMELCINSCAKSTVKAPVCGSNNFNYNNLDQLLCAQVCGVDVSEQRLSMCTTGINDGSASSGSSTTPPIQGRTTMTPEFVACISSCPATTEYNPVCGTDGVTYTNLGQLWCAQQCGLNVGLHRQSPCPVTSATPPSVGSTTQSPDVVACIRSCPVTSEYNPVCGTDNVTYTNTGRLECAKFCGVDVNIQRESACPATLATLDFEATTKSMATSTSPPIDQNNVPVEPLPLDVGTGAGFTIPADLLASVFTEAPPTAAPDEDIDPRFNNDGRNNNTDTSSIQFQE